MSLVSLARAAGVTWLFSNSPSCTLSRSVRAGRHEHNVDVPLVDDLANLLAIFGQGAEANFAGVHLGRLPGGANAERHVRVFGVGNDEVWRAGGIGMNGGQLLIERFLHGKFLKRFRARWLTRRADATEHGVDGFAQHLTAFAEGLQFFGPQLDFEPIEPRPRGRPRWGPTAPRRECRSSLVARSIRGGRGGDRGRSIRSLLEWRCRRRSRRPPSS